MPIDKRLLGKMHQHFGDVLADLRNALSDIQTFGNMMACMNDAYATDRQSDLLDFVEPITRWYSREMVVTLRRLADNRKDVHSLARLLLELRSLHTRDIYGVPFEKSDVDRDISTVEGVAKHATDIANNLITHLSENAAPQASMTYAGLHDSVLMMADVYDKYAARFYGDWDKTRPKEFKQDA